MGFMYLVKDSNSYLSRNEILVQILDSDLL